MQQTAERDVTGSFASFFVTAHNSSHNLTSGQSSLLRCCLSEGAAAMKDLE